MNRARKDEHNSDEGKSTKANLELEKLLLEVRDLRRPRLWSSLATGITIIIAVVTVAAGAIEFWLNSEREFRKPFLEKQIDIYLEATDAAAKIANNLQGPTERTAAELKLKELFFGKLVIVEDVAVNKAMRDFESCLDGIVTECKNEYSRQHELENFAGNLALQCRRSVGNSWNIRQADISGQRTEMSER